jgi:hypothetical protein
MFWLSMATKESAGFIIHILLFFELQDVNFESDQLIKKAGRITSALMTEWSPHFYRKRARYGSQLLKDVVAELHKVIE